MNNELYRRAQRLQNKAEKRGYEFNDIQLGMFRAMGKGEWDEEKINWLVIKTFEDTYRKFYPIKQRQYKD